MNVNFLKIIVFILICISAAGYAQRLSKQQVEKIIDERLETYDPDSFQMIQMIRESERKFQVNNRTYHIGTQTPISFWVQNRSEKGIISALNTIVHESNHEFYSSLPMVFLKKQGLKFDFKEKYSLYYINSTSIFLVKQTQIFSSHLLKKHIPKSLRTFRFRPYIAPKRKNLGSQSDGIYGLIGEWNAYYLGSRMSVNLFNYFKGKFDVQNSQAFLNYLKEVSNVELPYYEFKYFILKYLEIAKNEHPDIFQEIVANKELKTAYNRINEAYLKVLNQHYTQLNILKKIAKTQNISCFEKDYFFFIGDTGIQIYSEDLKNIKKELNKTYYQNLERYLLDEN